MHRLRTLQPKPQHLLNLAAHCERDPGSSRTTRSSETQSHLRHRLPCQPDGKKVSWGTLLGRRKQWRTRSTG